MHSSPISLKAMLYSILISLCIIVITIVNGYLNNQTKIIFCDVGQGDGIYIRIKNKIDVMIDAGPDNGMMLSCLGKHMPFFDKQIEIAFLSHPQSDHYGGYLSILDRYQVQHLYISERGNSNKSIAQIFQKILKQKGKTSVIRAGQNIYAIDGIFHIYWPPSYLVNANGIPTIRNSDDNVYSSVFSFKENGVSVLFTGDTPSSILSHVIKNTNVEATILKVSHHGSKNGTSQEFASLAHPSFAVISVGKKNGYGHPSKNVLEIFKALKIPVRRTDEEGDIVIKL